MENNTRNLKKAFVIRINHDPHKYGVILFPLFNILSFITAFIVDIKAGALTGLLIFLYVILHRDCLKCFRDPAFVLFYLANVLSIYAYFFNGRPLIIFASCITYNLFPMLMYGIGRASTATERDNPVFKALLFSNLVIVLIGFIIYFSPSLAAKVGMDSMTTAGISSAGVGYRFGSYMGSLELGSICAISIPILLMFRFKHKLIKPLMLIVFSVALFLTLQRGAWIVGIVSMVTCMIISAIMDREGFKIVFLYFVGGAIILFVMVYFVDHYMSAGFIQHLTIRIQRFNYSAMSAGRSEQASKGFDLFFHYPFGFGLGAAGNKASAYHMQVVPDGNLIRILVETGIVGMASFVIMNLKAVYQGIKNKYYYMTVIILLFLMHSVGSNVLDFYYGSFVYWYILGFLSRPKCVFDDIKYSNVDKG